MRGRCAGEICASTLGVAPSGRHAPLFHNIQKTRVAQREGVDIAILKHDANAKRSRASGGGVGWGGGGRERERTNVREGAREGGREGGRRKIHYYTIIILITVKNNQGNQPPPSQLLIHTVATYQVYLLFIFILVHPIPQVKPRLYTFKVKTPKMYYGDLGLVSNKQRAPLIAKDGDERMRHFS